MYVDHVGPERAEQCTELERTPDDLHRTLPEPTNMTLHAVAPEFVQFSPIAKQRHLVSKSTEA
jgi:hypothetical protein